MTVLDMYIRKDLKIEKKLSTGQKSTEKENLNFINLHNILNHKVQKQKELRDLIEKRSEK